MPTGKLHLDRPDRRTLNRATLARQLLLERASEEDQQVRAEGRRLLAFLAPDSSRNDAVVVKPELG